MTTKKLTCHCGGVEGEVTLSENGFKKIMRCNCSICKRKMQQWEWLKTKILKLLKEKTS